MRSAHLASVHVAVVLAAALLTSPLHAQEAPAPAEQPAAVLTPEPVDAPPPGTKKGKKDKKGKQGKQGKGKSKVKVSGFIQVFFRVKRDTDNNGHQDASNFRVQRARVRVSGVVAPRIGYVVEIDPRAPLVTGLMRDAYFSIKLPGHQMIRIGQQKTQFGYENRESSTRLFFVNRTEVADSLSRGITLRDIGVGLLGEFRLSPCFAIENAITVVNGNGMNTQIDDTPMKNVWGRVGVRWQAPALTVWLGVSGAVGDQLEIGDDLVDPADDFEFDFWRVGADLELDHRWVFLAAEGVRGRDTITKGPMVGGTMTGDVEDSMGGYVLIAGKTPWRAGPLLRYERVDSDWERWTFGAYYGLPSDRFRLLFNAELRSETDNAFYLWSQVRF